MHELLPPSCSIAGDVFTRQQDSACTSTSRLWHSRVYVVWDSPYLVLPANIPDLNQCITISREWCRSVHTTVLYMHVPIQNVDKLQWLRLVETWAESECSTVGLHISNFFRILYQILKSDSFLTDVLKIGWRFLDSVETKPFVAQSNNHGYKIKRLVVALTIIFVLKILRLRDGATVGLRATSSCYVTCKRIRPASFVRERRNS